jgi:NAD dependent epimerase/dehydratase
MKLKGKQVLVTGAGGFIGSHLVEALLKRGAKVKALVHYNSRNDWGMLEFADRYVLEKLEVITGDIRDSDCIRASIADCDIVFHLAALIGIPYSYVNPRDVLDTNVRGTLNVLQAARDFLSDKVIHLSTSEVYGTAERIPMDENHPLKPQSPYAATKVAADQLALSFYRAFKVPVAIARPFNVYGPRQSARAIVPTIISQALEKKSVKLGSIYTTRDLTFVTDTVEGLIKICESDNTIGEVVNLGSGFEISIEELVELVARSLRKTIRIVSESNRKRPAQSEVERLCSDSRKAQKLISWFPKVTLQHGLTKSIVWIEKHRHFYKSELYNV